MPVKPEIFKHGAKYIYFKKICVAQESNAINTENYLLSLHIVLHSGFRTSLCAVGLGGHDFAFLLLISRTFCRQRYTIVHSQGRAKSLLAKLFS